MHENPLESWVDSDSIPGKLLESWVESIQLFEILLKSWADSNQSTWANARKRSTKFSESPKKYVLEMQSLSPAARPVPKFRSGQTFCGARTKSAGLMPGSEEAIAMHYVLDAGLRVVLERGWPDSMLSSADFVRRRSGLGLCFWEIFACLGATMATDFEGWTWKFHGIIRSSEPTKRYLGVWILMT